MASVFERVRDIAADKLSIEADDIKAESSFTNDLNADSLDVVELIIPQEFESFPPQARNLSFVVNCHARVGGVSWRYPLAAAYMDGL